MTAATANASARPAPLRFTAGARSRDTGVFYDESASLGGTSVTLPEAPVPPGDYLNEVTIMVEVTGSNDNATVAMAADAPWNLFAEVAFLDAAGNTVHALTGFNMYLANLLFGYKFQTELAAGPGYSAPVTGGAANAGSFAFIMRIPVLIIDRDGIGAYPNGASNAVTRVRLTLAPLGTVYDTAPNDGGASVRVRMIERGVVLPASASPAGTPYADQPAGAGTFQQLSQVTFDFTAGRRTLSHTRKGNVYRALGFVFRNASGARADNLVEEFAFRIDDVPVVRGPYDYLRRMTWERQLLEDIPTGVVVADFAHEWDGKLGGELRDRWIMTQPGTKVEAEFTASATGTLTIITNEVVPKSGVLRA